ncbi:MAG: serine hydrolase domain-containing protein [Saprospiraceae bacterium]|nr:serine hydrolase domain-containing protein [Saprospiraceae bacterium]
MKTLLFVPFCYLIFISSHFSQVGDCFVEAVEAVHEKQRNVGLAAVIHRGGQKVFSHYQGMADLEHRVPVISETSFGMASITKVFTAVVLLQLEAEGLINLDAPVQRYIPEFPRKSETGITLRMLATHRSGIPHPSNRTPTLYATHYESALAAMEVYISDTLLFEPGTDRRYSSSNYNLLAAVIERTTDRLFTDVVQERIFLPLGLTHTHFDDPMAVVSHRARRYSYYHPWTYAESDTLFRVPSWDYSFNVGGGNINTTAEELATFGDALTAPGLLPKEQLEVLYSQAWFGEPYREGMFIYATGANPGLQAALTVFPEKQISVVILSNTWGKGSASAEMVELAALLPKECMGVIIPDE